MWSWRGKASNRGHEWAVITLSRSEGRAWGMSYKRGKSSRSWGPGRPKVTPPFGLSPPPPPRDFLSCLGPAQGWVRPGGGLLSIQR